MKDFSDDMFLDIFNMNRDMWTPKADIYETENFLVIRVAVSGLDPENLELTLSNDNSVLNVKGFRNEREDSDGEKIKYHRLEIFYGMFERDIELPDNVYIDRNKINAKYNDGMLTVKFAKSRKKRPISIEIED
ncbi:MAG: Hsp20/alpha crystallin family protein [Armatimonadetes bacterium]|nr:Hsp20/alpha crystallin family protein [Candidatus Hippobium faecium]